MKAAFKAISLKQQGPIVTRGNTSGVSLDLTPLLTFLTDLGNRFITMTPVNPAVFLVFYWDGIDGEESQVSNLPAVPEETPKE